MLSYPTQSSKASKIQKAPELQQDISFPVPFREQERYLKLADDFLALDDRPQKHNNVVPINRDRPVRERKKAA
jgi:hypothetical protein